MVNLTEMVSTAPAVTYFHQKGRNKKLENAVVNRIPSLFGMDGPLQWMGGSLAVGAGLPDLLIVSGRDDLRMLATAELCETKILAFLRVVNRATAPDLAAFTKRTNTKSIVLSGVYRNYRLSLATNAPASA